MNKHLSLGFIQIPILIAILALGVAGTYTVSKVPEIIREREYKKISQNTTIPEGTASSGEILIGFGSGTSQSQKDQVHQQIRSQLGKRVPQINTDLVRLPSSLSVQEAIARYIDLPGVEYAEPNFVATAFLTPNDPLYSNQWNLHKVLVEDSYDISQGGSVTIAIVDTGVNSSHQDLSGLVLGGYNTISEDTNTEDDNGHGTLVAGIASAKTNNSSGVASISYQTPILPVKVLDQDGVGTYIDVAEGIIYASENGGRIINLSLGGSSDSQTLKRAVDYAQSRGSMLVAASGNNGNDSPVYPASYQGVLAVSASDQNDSLASFSSYGSNTFVASPGVSITSTSPGNNYSRASGTSMSAPHLSGLLAIAISASPDLGNSNLVEHIKNNAEKVGPHPYDENGWNPYFGYGRISSGKTLNAIKEESEEPSPSPTPTPDPEEGGEKETRRGTPNYSFSFNLQGSVESKTENEGKITIKVEGGSPNTLNTVSGSLVDVYLTSQTTVRYQGQLISLGSITSQSRVNARGSIVENRLVADEIVIQTLQSTEEGNTRQEEGQSNNPGQGQSPANESGNQGQEKENSAPQINLPSQAQQKGRVKGTTTPQTFFESIKQRIVNLIYML